jgi:hypothetical protein
MSDEKTIDVAEGDQFTMFPDGTLCQYRNGYREWRGVAPHAATEWRDNGNNPAGADPDEIYVSKETAFRLLKSWVYTPAKPEQATINTLETELAQAKADRAALLLFVLQTEKKLGITESNRHPVVADALSRAGGK